MRIWRALAFVGVLVPVMLTLAHYHLTLVNELIAFVICGRGVLQMWRRDRAARQRNLHHRTSH